MIRLKRVLEAISSHTQNDRKMFSKLYTGYISLPASLSSTPSSFQKLYNIPPPAFNHFPITGLKEVQAIIHFRNCSFYTNHHHYQKFLGPILLANSVSYYTRWNRTPYFILPSTFHPPSSFGIIHEIYKL